LANDGASLAVPCCNQYNISTVEDAAAEEISKLQSTQSETIYDIRGGFIKFGRLVRSNRIYNGLEAYMGLVRAQRARRSTAVTEDIGEVVE
jgi:hypothetical protein